MLSNRGSARLGLAAAFGLFALSIAALLVGAADVKRVSPFVHLAPISDLAPGAAAPEFTLSDVDGKSLSLDSLKGQTAVLCFTAKGCPVSTDYDARLRDLSRQYAADGRVRFVAIHSNSPATDRADIRVQCAVAGLRFPQLVEGGMDVARRYGVANTPSFVVIDPTGTVRYTGAFDDSRDARRVKKNLLPDALAKVVGAPSMSIAKAGR